MYIYIYIYRERERDAVRGIHASTDIRACAASGAYTIHFTQYPIVYYNILEYTRIY